MILAWIIFLIAFSLLMIPMAIIAALAMYLLIRDLWKDIKKR